MFPSYNTESIEAIPLSPELKIYLEDKIVNKTESEVVATFNMSDLNELSYCNYWCEKCWKLQKIELEQVLYKFYANVECSYKKNMLRFFGFLFKYLRTQKGKGISSRFKNTFNNS